MRLMAETWERKREREGEESDGSRHKATRCTKIIFPF
jgi:hypothetical protein